MANNSTNTSIKGKNYHRITRTTEVYDESTGQFVIKKKQFYGKNKKEASQKFDDYKKYIEALKIELGKSSSEKLASRMFGESVKCYINNTFRPDPSIKDATKLRYINSYMNIFKDNSILSKPLKDVCGEDLQAVFTQSQYAPSSKEAALKLLRNYYKYAAAQNIANDITQVIVIPQAQKKRLDQSIEVYTEQEQDAFLERTPLDHRLRFLIVMALETGCRIGELCALTYSDIDLDSNLITINKSVSELGSIKGDVDTKKKAVEITTTKSTDSKRTMPITPLIKKELAIHKKWHKAEMVRVGYRNDYVFTTKSGELYFPSNLRIALKRLCNKIGIESKGWHTFRHTYGSELAAAGVPITEVSKLMGHSDITVTSKYYINITSEQKNEAIKKRELYRELRRSGAAIKA